MYRTVVHGLSSGLAQMYAQPRALQGEQGQAAKQEQSPEEQQQIAELKRRDAEVRAHEQAHMAAAGGYALGGASYTYQTGPDGRSYAVGGEVKIDTSPVSDDPHATIAKAQTIRAAALAPGEPSGADRAVAASASKMEADARRELAEKKAESQGAPDKAGQTRPGEIVDFLA